jgi:hypothetical protein
LAKLLAIAPGWSILFPARDISLPFQVFLGFWTLLLAMAAVLTGRPGARFLLALGMVAGVLALGSATPLYGLVHGLPLMRRFRGPVKFWPLCEVAVAWLAALGADRLWRGGRAVGRLLTVALVLAAVGERVAYNAPWLAYYAARPPLEALQPVLEKLAAYRELAGGSSIPPERVYLAFQDTDIVFGNLGIVAGIDSLTGGPTNFISSRQYSLLLGELDRARLDLFGVRTVFAERKRCDVLAARWKLDWRLAGDGACVLDNPARPSRYVSLENPLAVANEDEMVRAVARDAGGPVPVIASAATVSTYVGPASVPMRIDVRHFEPGDVLLRVDTSAPRLLLAREAWSPGWEARVDGDRVPVYPAAGIFFAVGVPVGQHAVEIVYKAPGCRPALVIPGLWLAVVLVSRRARSRVRATLT